MLNRQGIQPVVLLAAILLACIACPQGAFSQFSNHGATIRIFSAEPLSVKGPFTSTNSILGDGSIILSGESDQTIDMQGNSLPILQINNVQQVMLTGDLRIDKRLVMEQGYIACADHTLTMEDSATIEGYAENRFIITNGPGMVRKNQIGPDQQSDFLFPVGYSASEYNPIVVNNSGTTDAFSVRVTENAFGTTGQANENHFVRTSWVLSESVPGGSVLSLTAGWKASDEPGSFNRQKNGIALYRENQGWDLPSSGISMPVYNSYYTQTRNDIQTTGIFAIADSSLANRALLHLKVFLQGAYMGNGIIAGLMRDQLRSSQALPSNQPYNGGLYMHTGLQGGTEMVDPAVFNMSSEETNDIVDWIFVSLLNPTDPSQVLQTRSALLQRDGDIVDLDGISPLSMPINEEGQYLVGIGHRNHLRIRTPDSSPLLLTTNNQVASWDFTLGNGQAYQNSGILSNDAMIPVTQGPVTKYCMIGGNTDGLFQINSNARSVLYSGDGNDRNNILLYGLSGTSSNFLQVTMYNFEDIGMFDLNLDGKIIFSRDNNDPMVILDALHGNTSGIAREHY